MINPSLKDFAESETGIEITFDCNNKYAYDFIDKASHRTDDFKNILELADIYQSNLIKSGVLDV